MSSIMRRRKSSPAASAAGHLAAYTVLALGAFVMLLPFWYMAVFATHTNTEILSVPAPSWFGSHLMENLRDLLERRPLFWWSMVRSLWIAGAVFQVFVYFAYFNVAPQRDPPFEVWGITLRIIQIPLLLAVAWLALRPQEAATR